MLRGIALARDCPDMAGSLLAVGCVAILGFHVFVNIAITLHLMPITGIPLPFLSYGGSFCITTMMCVGTLLSVHVRKGYFD
jgi:rod shape determining protein RodA